MGLFYVTRLTAHREMLLHGKISAVQTTVDAFGLAGPTAPPHDLSKKILNSDEVKWMAVETPAAAILSLNEIPPFHTNGKVHQREIQQ